MDYRPQGQTSVATWTQTDICQPIPNTWVPGGEALQAHNNVLFIRGDSLKVGSKALQHTPVPNDNQSTPGMS